MKTKDKNKKNKIEINGNISPFNENSSFKTFSENFSLFKNGNKNEIIKDINLLNNFNLNNNENNNFNNINVENVINDLLIKRNEDIFINEKENIHLEQLEYKQNLYKTPQQFNTNSSSSINLSSNDMKEAYYIPKILSKVNSSNTTQQESYFLERKHNSLNNINLNLFKNNNHDYLNFNRRKSSINFNKNFDISNSSNIPLKSINFFDSKNIGSISTINLPNFQQCLNNNNLNNNPFHHMMPQLELNKCILKTQINNNNLFEKEKENTDILEINVKVSQTDILTFKIRRFSKWFPIFFIICEINKLDIKLIRPFIIYIIRALNSIYGLYNLNLKKDEIEIIKDIRKRFFNEDVEIEKEGKKNEKEINNYENFFIESHSTDIKDNNSNSEELF